MTISSAFTVNGAPLTAEVAVAYGSVVSLALVSLTDISTITWSIVGSSESTLVNPAITVAGTPSGATAQFTMVADPAASLANCLKGGRGVSFGVRCVVRDSNNNTSTTTATIGVVNVSKTVPGWVGEETERDSTHGWTEIYNNALADNVTGTGVATTVDATTASTFTYSLATQNTLYSCGCRAYAWDTVTGDNLLREWTWAYINIAGVISKIKADSDGGVYEHIDDAAWTVVVDTDGATTMRIRHTLDAANACKIRCQVWISELLYP